MTHYKKGKALQIQSMASQLINIGMEGNVAALIFYLKTLNLNQQKVLKKKN